MLRFKKYFRLTIWRKSWRFLFKLLLIFVKFASRHRFLRKTPIFSKKIGKNHIQIVIITSTPYYSVFIKVARVVGDCNRDLLILVYFLSILPPIHGGYQRADCLQLSVKHQTF
jgi:hypothetical protein